MIAVQGNEKEILDFMKSRSICDKNTRAASQHKSDQHLLCQEFSLEMKRQSTRLKNILLLGKTTFYLKIT